MLKFLTFFHNSDFISRNFDFFLGILSLYFTTIIFFGILSLYHNFDFFQNCKFIYIYIVYFSQL